MVQGDELITAWMVQYTLGATKENTTTEADQRRGRESRALGEVAGKSDPEPGSPTVSDLAIIVLRMDLANTYSEPLDLIV